MGRVGRGALLFLRPALGGPKAARYIDKIFKSASAADLPVEKISEIVICLNPKRAKELGITIPASVRVRANRVIE